jgi:uncharacterized pyridoxal phosphate-dependent enzyme
VPIYLSNLARSTRRQLLQAAGVIAGGWLLPTPADASGQTTTAGRTRKSIYETVGVRPLINARGTVTIVGASRTLPEVKRAMEEAARDYVQIDELMDGVGRRLAELTGAQWGMVTSGASAALTAATVGCIAGGDPDKLAQLPDLKGLKDEVIIPVDSRTAYDHAAKAAGPRMVAVPDRAGFERALGPRTAMIMVLAGPNSERGPLALTEIAKLAKPRGVPIVVDAAADALAVPNPYLTQGAHLVAYSGGKCLRGPQCAGLLLGRKDLVQAAWVGTAPHHGFGRGFKVGREEIMGMLAAVEMWMARNHAEELRTWNGWLEHIARRLQAIPGVETDIRQPQGLSNPTPSLNVQWDKTRIPLTGEDVEQLLWDGQPRIAVSGAGSFLPFPPNLEPNIQIIPYQLAAGEERVIADRVHAVLSNPPHKEPRTDAPAANVSGEWSVTLTFVASTATQTFDLGQKEHEVSGSHRGSFATRDIKGTLRGRDLVLRSSYTQQGVRLNFTFTGTVAGDGKAMEGRVSLGEYGTAVWKARRNS